MDLAGKYFTHAARDIFDVLHQCSICNVVHLLLLVYFWGMMLAVIISLVAPPLLLLDIDLALCFPALQLVEAHINSL
eukprot:8852135-Ditylum_brightwellii.AAC.1